MADPFVAEIRIFPFNFAPKGWAWCDGQLMPLAEAASEKSSTGSAWLSRSSYVPLVGTAFSVSSSTTAATFTLRAIGDLTPQPAKGQSNPADGRFSLVFTSSTFLTQSIRTVRHPVLGEASLFVVPIGPTSTPQSYEVIVNRLT